MRRVGPLVIFSVAFIVRLTYLVQMEPYPKFEQIRNRLDDQVIFDYWAKSIVRGDTPDFSTTGHEFAYWAAKNEGVFPQAPLYPYFLAGLYELFGFRYDWVRAVQMVLGAATAVLVFWIALRVLPPAAAMVSGLAAAFYGPFVYYEATFLRAAIASFVSALGLYLLQRTAETVPKARLPFILISTSCGLALAMGVLLRPNLLLFAIPAILWLYWGRARTGVPGTRLAVVLTVLAFTAPLIAVMTLNSVRSGRLAFISSNGPYIFYIGNVHDATGISAGVPPSYRTLMASGPPESIDLLEEALKDIRRHPGHYVRLQLRKLWYFFVPEEQPNNLSYSMAKKCNPALSLAFLEFHMILPVAIAGLLLSFGRWREFSLLYLFASSYTVATVAFYVLSRLRQPLLIPMFVLAGLAVQVWWRAVVERRFLQALAGVAVVVMAALYLAPHPAHHRIADYEMAAAAYFSAGDELERDMRLDEAKRHYVRAVVLNPDHDQALMRILSLGWETASRERSAKQEEADRLSEEARRLTQSEDYDQAISLLREAAQMAPEHPTPHHFLSNVYFLKGEPLRALEHLEKALALDPENQLFRQNLKALRRQVASSPL